MNMVQWLETQLKDPEFRALWDADDPEFQARFRRLKRKAFWRGARRGILWGNALGLPLCLVYLLGHYRGWWR